VSLGIQIWLGRPMGVASGNVEGQDGRGFSVLLICGWGW
jgi:hypothetical protein